MIAGRLRFESSTALQITSDIVIKCSTLSKIITNSNEETRINQPG